MTTRRSNECHAFNMMAYDDKSLSEADSLMIEEREMLISDLAEAGDAIENYLKSLYDNGGYQIMTKKAWGVFGDEHFPEILALIDKKIELLRRNYTPELAEKAETMLESKGVPTL